MHFLAALSRSRDISAWAGMFNDQFQLASPWKREVSGWGMFTGAKTHRRFPLARPGMMSISAGFREMACEMAMCLEQFPRAVDVVLVNSERWTEYHKAIMEALTEGVRMFLRTQRHLPFEKLLAEFKESQPCAVSGALQVSLLYGQEHALYLDDNVNLKMDVRGSVFKKP